MRVSFATVKINILYADGSYLECLSDLYEFTLDNINILSNMGFIFETFNHVRLSTGKVLELYGYISNSSDVSSCLDRLAVS